MLYYCNKINVRKPFSFKCSISKAEAKRTLMLKTAAEQLFRNADYSEKYLRL